jgi:EAL domain-containing protein (putative c-di-GMP-specific phosphodiesterase class I)
MTSVLDHPGSAVVDDVPVTDDALKDLLRRQLLQPVFQPVVSLSDGVVRGVEGLIRGPAGTELFAPDQLFGAALRAGRLTELDQAARAAITAAAVECPQTPPLVIVNIEPAWLDEEAAAALLTLIRVPQPFRYVLEVTETALVQRPALVLRLAAEVRRLGHWISLDDVGTDLRSLKLLEVLEPEIIKLDRHIVRDPRGKAARQVVPGVVGYAARTGSVVLAEGIETPEDLAVAVGLGATWGQGWLFGRPVPLTGAALLAAGQQAERLAVAPKGRRSDAGHDLPVGTGEGPTAAGWAPGARSDRLERLLDASGTEAAWAQAGSDWLLAHKRRLPWQIPEVQTVARLILPTALVGLAFPNVVLFAARGVLLTGADARLLLLSVLCGLYAICCVRPRHDEPNVHDRGLDRIIGFPLVAAGIWLALGWPVSGGVTAPPSTHEVLAAITFFAGSGVLLWGTRIFRRLRWALCLLVLGVPTMPHHRVVDEVAVTFVTAAIILELRWRVRNRPARDEGTRIVTQLTGANRRSVHYFPPAFAPVAVLSLVAFALAGVLISGGRLLSPASQPTSAHHRTTSSAWHPRTSPTQVSSALSRKAPAAHAAVGTVRADTPGTVAR